MALQAGADISDWDPALVSLVTVVLVCIGVVMVSAVLALAVHGAEHVMAGVVGKAMMDTVMRELTMVGLLSLVMFLSSTIIGSLTHTEEFAHFTHELVETVEWVHMVLAALAFFFIFIGANRFAYFITKCFFMSFWVIIIIPKNNAE